MKISAILLLLIFILLKIPAAFAEEKILNIYAWAEEIPDEVITQFENETGIKVNYASYDSNEIMFAKLLTNHNIGYDIIEPSNYYVSRLQRQDFLEILDKQKLSNLKNLDPFFLNQAYMNHNLYSVPFVWGTTGIFVNQDYFKQVPSGWESLLDKAYLNQLLMLDDSREVFSIGLKILGYSINDNNPLHIQEAYFKLKDMLGNIRVFNIDAATSIMIDEDATIGMAMNGDCYNAAQENPKLLYIYPKDGFMIWVDNFAILKNAPHRNNAYLFLNFLLRPDIAKKASLAISYASANLAAQRLMPPEIRDNTILYPSHELLKRGEFQQDIGQNAAALIEKYWEQLKMAG